MDHSCFSAFCQACWHGIHQSPPRPQQTCTGSSLSCSELKLTDPASYPTSYRVYSRNKLAKLRRSVSRIHFATIWIIYLREKNWESSLKSSLNKFDDKLCGVSIPPFKCPQLMEVQLQLFPKMARLLDKDEVGSCCVALLRSSLRFWLLLPPWRRFSESRRSIPVSEVSLKRASDYLGSASDSLITRFLFCRQVAPGGVLEGCLQWVGGNPDLALDDLDVKCIIGGKS